jgi:hypothetical protein
VAVPVLHTTHRTVQMRALAALLVRQYLVELIPVVVVVVQRCLAVTIGRVALELTVAVTVAVDTAGIGPPRSRLQDAPIRVVAVVRVLRTALRLSIRSGVSGITPVTENPVVKESFRFVSTQPTP